MGSEPKPNVAVIGAARERIAGRIGATPPVASPARGAVTICDLTGTGVRDTAIATLARGRAEARGAGAGFEN